MKFVVDSAIPFIAGVLEPYGEVVYRAGAEFSREDVVDADMLIIRTRTRCGAELLEGSGVGLIATATIGFDHIDMEWCRSHGIEVVTAAGCNAAGVLQWVAAVLARLSAMQGWRPEESTLGIVGVGNVGRLVEHYARSWGFRVLCCDPPRAMREGGDFVELEELVRHSDIVTFHTPLDASTFHMIDSKLLGLMHDDAVVINASRGEVASTEALLKAKQLLCLDVWESEPHINRTLLEKAVVSTPHIAGYSLQGKANAAVAVVRAAARKYALPLEEWYPSEVVPALRREITWQQMQKSIEQYCDVERESQALKSSPQLFEQMRNNYHYRQEYF